MPLPACLRGAMTDKFAQFDEYQLAKYSPRKHRAKRRPRPPPRPPVSPCSTWSFTARTLLSGEEEGGQRNMVTLGDPTLSI